MFLDSPISKYVFNDSSLVLKRFFFTFEIVRGFNTHFLDCVSVQTEPQAIAVPNQIYLTTV